MFFGGGTPTLLPAADLAAILRAIEGRFGLAADAEVTVAAAAEARAVGFEHVSLDLIYGTPSETDADWRALAGGCAFRRA